MSKQFAPANVLHLPQPKAESLEHRGALAPSYDGISTEFGTRPVEMATLLGAESLLRGLEKNNLSRRKKGDPRRALVTRINVSHVLSAGLGGGVYPKARLAYKFSEENPGAHPDNTPLTAAMLAHKTLQVADLAMGTHPDQITHIAGNRKQRTKQSALEAYLKGTTTHDIATGETQADGLLSAGLRRKKALARIKGTNTRRDKRERKQAGGANGAYDNIFDANE